MSVSVNNFGKVKVVSSHGFYATSLINLFLYKLFMLCVTLQLLSCPDSLRVLLAYSRMIFHAQVYGASGIDFHVEL